MTDPDRPGESVSRRTGLRANAVRSVRLPLSGLMLVGALLLAVLNDWFRSLESIAAGPLVRLGTGSTVIVRPALATVFFDVYTRRYDGLSITPECTSALPIAALIGLAGAMTLSGRFPIGRILTGLGVASLTVFVVNELRVLLIAWSTHEWGQSGYGWAHTTVGSLVTIAGVTAGIAAFLAIVTRNRTRRGDATDHQGRRLR